MNANHYLILDIETRPLPLEVLKERGLFPKFKPPANYKDPEKIKAAELEHEAKCLESAALDPIMSEVCAVGVLTDRGEPHTFFGPEPQLIMDLWEDCSDALNQQGMIIGFNICSFDLTYLFRRSWALGIKPLMALRNGRYWSHHVVDLLDQWKLGNYQDSASLDRICRHLGIPGKTGSGKDFAKLLETDHEAAKEYLIGDLTRTQKVAQRIGVIP